jgi:hypothetical protein
MKWVILAKRVLGISLGATFLLAMANAFVSSSRTDSSASLMNGADLLVALFGLVWLVATAWTAWGLVFDSRRDRSMASGLALLGYALGWLFDRFGAFDQEMLPGFMSRAAEVWTSWLWLLLLVAVFGLSVWEHFLWKPKEQVLP